MTTTTKQPHFYLHNHYRESISLCWVANSTIPNPLLLLFGKLVPKKDVIEVMQRFNIQASIVLIVYSFKTPTSIVLIVYTFIVVWFVGGLTAFYLYLSSTNQTTYENFRYRYDRRANPYNKGIVQKFKEIFCSSKAPSKKNFSALVPKEPPPLARPMGAGFVSPNTGKGADDHDVLNIKGGRLSETSRDISQGHVDEIGDRVTLNPRHSSWGRQRGNWEMSPEVVAMAARVNDQNRFSGTTSTQK